MFLCQCNSLCRKNKECYIHHNLRYAILQGGRYFYLHINCVVISCNGIIIIINVFTCLCASFIFHSRALAVNVLLAYLWVFCFRLVILLCNLCIMNFVFVTCINTLHDYSFIILNLKWRITMKNIFLLCM